MRQRVMDTEWFVCKVCDLAWRSENLPGNAVENRFRRSKEIQQVLLSASAAAADNTGPPAKRSRSGSDGYPSSSNR
ncbi:hypothetical protein Plhal304r1_c007g0028831 [Plasmopara halstedii]